MSRIEEMITEMCPEGVEYKPLGSFMIRNKGMNITAGDMKKKATPDGDVKVFAAGKTEAMMSSDDLNKKRIYDKPSVICKARGNIEFAFYDKPFTHKSEIWSYTASSETINPKFYYYYLSSIENRLQQTANERSGKLPQLRTTDTDDLQVPVPPIEIQDAIVEILDTFTELEAELEAELEGRRQQYEYYRNLLLSFDKREREKRFIEIFCANHGIDFNCDRDLEWKELGNVLNVLDSKRKPITKSSRQAGEYPYYGANGVTDYVKNYIFDGTFILMGEDGSVITPSGNPILNWAEGKIWVNNHAHVLAEKETNLRYCYYALSVQSVRDIVRGTPPKINQFNMRMIKIPIPPLPVQQLIVDVLDKFSTLTEGITEGLPKELELHRKQYEYYRNYLLSFPRREDASSSEVA